MLEGSAYLKWRTSPEGQDGVSMYDKDRNYLGLVVQENWSDQLRNSCDTLTLPTAQKIGHSKTVSKATRRLHVGTQEMNQTINNAFVRIAASADLPLRFQGAQRPTVLSLTVGNLRISNRLRFHKN
jgi:hypothetical protein